MHIYRTDTDRYKIQMNKYVINLFLKVDMITKQEIISKEHLCLSHHLHQHHRHLWWSGWTFVIDTKHRLVRGHAANPVLINITLKFAWTNWARSSLIGDSNTKLMSGRSSSSDMVRLRWWSVLDVPRAFDYSCCLYFLDSRTGFWI